MNRLQTLRLKNSICTAPLVITERLVNNCTLAVGIKYPERANLLSEKYTGSFTCRRRASKFLSSFERSPSLPRFPIPQSSFFVLVAMGRRICGHK